MKIPDAKAATFYIIIFSQDNLKRVLLLNKYYVILKEYFNDINFDNYNS